MDVVDEVTTILEQFPILFNKISIKFKDVNTENELANVLCNYEDKQKLIVPLLFKTCKSAVNLTKTKQTTEKVDEIREGIRRMLNCLSVLSIDSEWINREVNGSSKVIKIPVQTSFGQVSTAGRIGQVIPSLTIKGHNNIVGKHEINPYKLGTWSDAKNVAVNAILKFVYNEVFYSPEKRGNVKEGEAISESERVDLNNEIKISAEAGTRHFYCVLNPKELEPHFLKDPKLIQQLKELLPALDIFEVKDILGNIVFLVADEQLMSQSYHHFLKQLENW